MCFQVAWCCRRIPTAVMGADKGFFFWVDAQMSFQIAWCCRRILTAVIGTGKGFFSWVDANMYFQVACCCGQIATAVIGAGEGFFAWADAPMSSQVAWLRIRMSAAFLWTEKGAFSGVVSQVTAPVAGSIERCVAVGMRADTRSSWFSAGAVPCVLWLICDRQRGRGHDGRVQHRVIRWRSSAFGGRVCLVYPSWWLSCHLDRASLRGLFLAGAVWWATKDRRSFMVSLTWCLLRLLIMASATWPLPVEVIRRKDPQGLVASRPGTGRGGGCSFSQRGAAESLPL